MLQSDIIISARLVKNVVDEWMGMMNNGKMMQLRTENQSIGR